LDEKKVPVEGRKKEKWKIFRTQVVGVTGLGYVSGHWKEINC